MTVEFPKSNLTWSILASAKAGEYAVAAYNCYNNDGVMAVIRAAERPHFVRYVVSAAHAASVPIAVHLDHCIKAEDIELALTLPFDSIMIDGSTLEEVENINFCADIVARARAAGITIEVEMGRIEGGEDGLPSVDMGAVLTVPSEATKFMQATGAHFLAPSFGNIHGGYGREGAEKLWNLDLLTDLRQAVPADVPLVLHGTHPVSDELFLKAITCGVSKINVNRTVRDDYTRFVAENSGSLELTDLQVQAVEVYTRSITRIMDLFGSSGKGRSGSGSGCYC